MKEYKWDTAMDLKRVCRICLKINQLTYDIFSNSHVTRKASYSEMLSICTKIKPHQLDGLPHIICKQCSRQLKKVYAFNVLCEKSDNVLRNYLEYISNSKLDGSEVKEEFDKVKEEDLSKCENDNTENFISKNLRDESKDDIKVELTCVYDNDDGWDDDDNSILLSIKSKSEGDNTQVEHTANEKPKSKRRRKKSVVLEGEEYVPDSKLPHQCDVCGKILSTRSNLKAHKICHTELRPFKCDVCPASFRGYSALFQHRKVHTGEKSYHCEYCPKQFRRRTGLVNHIRMHTGEKLYNCDLCMKAFVQSAQLSIHMKRHKGDKTFLCHTCGKGFPIKADLIVHQRIHNGEKPYSCHLCPKTFATSGNLSIHVRIHKKEIRYHCKECQRGFVTCSAYNVHVKRHKGQRDYQCDCGKTFYTSSALKQHRVVHTGEKKYQCKICDRKFTQTSHLTRHFKRDHAKPNMPVPSSDHYKLVLNQPEEKGFGFLNAHNLLPDGDVKCEAT